MRTFRNLGINRLSLGVQSFDDHLLTILGRRHSAKSALRAIHWADDAGFDNLSIDLMFDIPGQTMESWEQTLAMIKDLPITHLSLYNLVFELNTLFYRRKKRLFPLLPKDSLSIEMWEVAVDFFSSISLERYEISAFAKKGFYSRHNTGYWIGRPFFGLGPSAFSYVNGKRFQNTPHLEHYCQSLQEKKLPISFEETLFYPKNVTELLAVELRLIQGVMINLFQEKHGKLPNETLQILQQLEKKELLEKKEDAYRLSKKGLLFYDTVAADLLYTDES